MLVGLGTWAVRCSIPGLCMWNISIEPAFIYAFGIFSLFLWYRASSLLGKLFTTQQVQHFLHSRFLACLYFFILHYNVLSWLLNGGVLLLRDLVLLILDLTLANCTPLSMCQPKTTYFHACSGGHHGVSGVPMACSCPGRFRGCTFRFPLPGLTLLWLSELTMDPEHFPPNRDTVNSAGSISVSGKVKIGNERTWNLGNSIGNSQKGYRVALLGLCARGESRTLTQNGGREGQRGSHWLPLCFRL
jgi:hypothetical protein